MTRKLLSILALLCLTTTSAWAQKYCMLFFKANGQTVTKIVYPWDFENDPDLNKRTYTIKCNESGNDELDIIIQALYGKSAGRYDSNYAPSVSGNENAIATIKEGCLWITINEYFIDAGTTKFEGYYCDVDGVTPYDYSLEITCTSLDNPFESENVTAHEGKTGEYWATYYNNEKSYKADTKTTVYQAAVNGTKTGVTLTEVKNQEIPVGKAVILKSSASTITLTLAGTTQILDDNELEGTDYDLTTPANAYCLSNETTGTSPRGVGFYKFTGTTIPAHRAYLVVDDGPTNARGFLGFGGDHNTTDIALPEAVVIEGDSPIYDLSGRRVIGKPQKGFYVKNGKKVVIN